MRKILFIARKEFRHVLRDPRSLVIVLLMPVLMTLLYGHAINMDVEHVTLAVIDSDRSTLSRDLLSRFFASGYFDHPTESGSDFEPEEILRSGHAHAVLVIQPEFGSAIERGEKVRVGLIVDGSDNNVSAAVQNYAVGVVQQFNMSRIPPGIELPGVAIAPQVMYNPDLKSSHFFVPGLVAILLMMISALLTSITIAREKETGTMEQLLTAPVTPLQILTGKIVPYLLIACVDGAIVIAMAQIVYGVPFTGSHLLTVAFGLVYISTALSLGVLISTLVATQQVAMMLAIMITVMPSVMLSGYVFAIKYMPIPLQVISHIVAARYFVPVIRGVMLKGSDFASLLPQGIGMLSLMVVFMSLALVRFNKRTS
jgi:ABC-2 type transport system permease protein